MLKENRSTVKSLKKKTIVINKRKKYFLQKRKFKYLNKFDFSCFSSKNLLQNDAFLKLRYVNKIDLRFSPNNIFGTCGLLSNSKVLSSVSGGSFKLHSSRKMKKHVFKTFLTNFRKTVEKTFRRRKKEIKNRIIYYENTIITFILNKKFRRQIKKTFKFLKNTNKKVKKNKILYIIRPKKCFNGCRVSKKRRKKHIRFRTFKQ